MLRRRATVGTGIGWALVGCASSSVDALEVGNATEAAIETETETATLDPASQGTETTASADGLEASTASATEPLDPTSQGAGGTGSVGLIELDCPPRVKARPFASADGHECTAASEAAIAFSLSGCRGLQIDASTGAIHGRWPMSDCTATVVATDGEHSSVALIEVRLEPLETFDGASRFEDPERGPAFDLAAAEAYVYIGGSSYEVPGGFTNTGLAWDPIDARLVVADFLSGDLVLLSRDGARQSEISTPVTPESLQGVAWDASDDSFWLADHYAEEVLHIDRSGAPLPGALTALGWRPNGLAHDPRTDTLWVVRASSNEIHRFSCSDGAWLDSMNVPGTSLLDGAGLDTETGHLWLTYDGGATGIVELDPTSGEVVSAISDPGGYPEGVLVSGDELWINDDGEHHGGFERGNRLHHATVDGQPLPFNSLPAPPFSIELWARLDPGADTRQTLAWIGRTDVAAEGYALYVRRDGAGQLEAWQGSSAGEAAATASGEFSTGAWHHVVAVFASDIERRVYLDGAHEGSDTQPVPLPIVEVAALGRRSAMSAGDPLSGAIAGVAIHDRVLSPDEVAVMFRDAARP